MRALIQNDGYIVHEYFYSEGIGMFILLKKLTQVFAVFHYQRAIFLWFGWIQVRVFAPEGINNKNLCMLQF